MDNESASIAGSIVVDDMHRLVELSEAHAYEDLVRHAPNHVVERYGLAVHRVGSAYVFVAARFCDTLILNRVIGLGIAEPVTDELLSEIEAIYATSGVHAYAAEMGPAGQSQETAARLRAHGFVAFKRTSMLYRQAEAITAQMCKLRVVKARHKDGPVFAELASRIFEFGEPMPTLLRATFDRPSSWQHWLAFHDEQPVATAITFLAGDVAWIGWVCTDPDYRGRGAQTSLTIAQLEGAVLCDARWITLEASPGTRKRPSQSLRNYLRLGWIAAHDRLVYVFKASPADRRSAP